MKYDIAVDMGSSNTVIYKNEVGVALVEPTLLLLNESSKNPIVDYGENALNNYPGLKDSCKLMSPIRNGAIINKDFVKSLLKYFLNKIEEKQFFKGNFLWILPSTMSQNDKNEFINIAYSLGYKNVDTIPSSVCALYQLEVEQDNPYSHMVVNIGGGATDVAVVYKGKVVQGCSVDIGGEIIDNSIKKYLFDNYNSYVTRSQAENIKQNLASLTPNDMLSTIIPGTNIDEYTNSEISVSAQELRGIYTQFYEKICSAISAVLNMCNSQIVRDINKMGIYLCGGMANFIGLDKFMRGRLGVNVYVDERPSTTVIFGCEKLFNEPNNLKDLIALNN